MIGALLVVGGAIKLSPWREIALLPWLVLPAPAVFFIGLGEFVLGCLVLSFSCWRVIGWASRAAFTVYVLLLLVQFRAGESVCQCMGSRSPPILLMLVVDSLLLLSMWWLRAYWREPLSWSREGRLSPVVEVLAATRFALPFLILLGMFAFGSTDAAISYATGARLLATNGAQFVGQLQDNETGTAVFELTNYSGSTVHILGAKSSCRCMALDDLPLTLVPGASGHIRVRMKGRGGDRPQIQRETATLIFDDPARSMTLTVTASVMPPP